MNNIANYFDKMSKKRGLSSQSNDGDSAKKVRKGTSEASDVSINEEDVFQKVLLLKNALKIYIIVYKTLINKLRRFIPFLKKRKIVKLKVNFT